jgi:RNA polymerase sigma factor (sigma-70 family)
MSRSPLHSAACHLRRLTRPSSGDRSDEELLEAFTLRHDEGAFTALVRRYSPLVMSVCRRALGHQQDAEDAFQATFLVLARKASSIRRQGALASWLHGVSQRIALDVRRSLVRQREREQHGARAEAAPGTEDLSWREVQALLDEEVQALPDVYRQVFVLCGLQGLSKPEAAQQLRLKEGTVASRLARARERLRERLQERGVTLSALMAVLDLTSEGVGVGTATVETTAAWAVAYAAGACGCSVVPARVASLADGVSATMLFTKTRIITALVLLVGLLATGAGLLFAALPAQPPSRDDKPAAKDAAARKTDTPKPAEVRCRVVGPDAKPVKGAKVYQVVQQRMDDLPPGAGPKLLAQTGGDGRFQAPRPATGNTSTVWMAVAADLGPALVESKALVVVGEVTFRLVKDVPIVGRIVNLEGKPVAGVTVQPFVLGLTPKEDVGPLIEAVRARKRFRIEEFCPTRLVSPAGIPGLPARLVTAADGRFRLTGVGRERLVALLVSGPKVDTDMILVMTRAGKPFRLPDSPDSELEFRVYPATFQHAVSPPQPLVGTVRDRQTGKPIAGAVVDAGLGELMRARTKEDGTYRFDSLPGLMFQAGGPRMVELIAVGPADQPYVPALKEAQPGRRTEPMRVDFTLSRGVWVEGRLTNKRTGKPVGAAIEYYAATRNPALKDVVDFPGRRRLSLNLFYTRTDGSFRVPVLPGPGAIAASVSTGKYLRGGSLTQEQYKQLLLPSPSYLGNFHAIALIDPRAGETGKCDLTVDPGQTLTCQVLDPDGKPVSGARVHGHDPLYSWTPRPLPTATFTLEAVRPNASRWLLVLHPGRHLGASVDVQAGSKESVAIRLTRTGTITGRLLGPDGDPWKQQDLRVFSSRRGGILNAHLPDVVRTGDDGRFRVEGIIPGLTYQVVVAGKPPRATIGSVKVGLELKPGEVRALGDVKARLFRE